MRGLAVLTKVAMAVLFWPWLLAVGAVAAVAVVIKTIQGVRR